MFLKFLSGDGVGAAAKQKADRAIKSGHDITNAEQFVANNSKDGVVHYLLVPIEDTYRCREMLAWFVTPKRVPGTMKFHDIMVLKQSSTITVRKMACYSTECCWDDENMGPRNPQLPCSTHEECRWGIAELFDADVLKRLETTRKDIEKKKAKQTRIERRKVKVLCNVVNYFSKIKIYIMCQ